MARAFPRWELPLVRRIHLTPVILFPAILFKGGDELKNPGFAGPQPHSQRGSALDHYAVASASWSKRKFA
jgi:hypothetical protein